MTIVRYPVKEKAALRQARKDANEDYIRCQNQTVEQFCSMLKKLDDRVREAEEAFAIALGEFHVAVAVEAAARQKQP